MAVQIMYDCKVCGGNLVEKSPGMAKCESCRREQSIPLKANVEMINRANRLRMNNKNFDEAKALYEKVVSETPDEAEAYWGIVLCRYGIEFVEDKQTEKYIPTCHRTIDTSIKSDEDFIIACEKANDEVREYYIQQAEYIDSVQQKIHEIVAKEKPYDVFISYKATDDNGVSTPDSKEALKIYHKLDKKGFKVFFAEETLKQHAGEEYEPYIYAALKTSKVMILIGSSEEYFDAPWVRNEWSRFLDMMNHGNEKKKLLPFYFDMEPYDLPSEIVNCEALNWRDAEAMSNMLMNVEAFLGYKETQNAYDVKDIDNVIANREQEKISQKLQNAEQLARSGHVQNAIQVLDELIREFPGTAEAYWLRMMLKLGETEETIKQRQIDLYKEPDYISAINNAQGEQLEKYKKVEELCRANCLLQAEYNEKSEQLINKYSSIYQNAEIGQIRQRLEEIIKKKAFYPVTVLACLIAFVVLLAIAIIWLYITGGTAKTVAPEHMSVAVIFACILFFAVIVTLFVLCGKFTDSTIVALICTGIGTTLVIALIAFLASNGILFFIICLSAVIFAIMTVIKVLTNIKKKALVKEYNGLIAKLEQHVTALGKEFDIEHNSLIAEYRAKASISQTTLTFNDGQSLYKNHSKAIGEYKKYY